MTALFLYDDTQARTFEPFASTRPVSELVAGTSLIRERWQQLFPSADIHFLTDRRNTDFDEPGGAAVGRDAAGGVRHRQRAVCSGIPG